jgi:hypothetical protein
LNPEQNCNSASASDRLWNGFPVDDDPADVQSIDFLTMLFLDPGILQHGQVEISRAATPIPAHVLNILGDMTEIRATASKFFEHIHLYLPFVSKKRFYELYLRPSFYSRPDLVLPFPFYQAHDDIPSHKSPESSNPPISCREALLH